MLEAIQNITSYKLATSSRPSGFAGTLARLGIANKMNTDRGITGALANAGITYETAKLGLGAAAGLAVVGAGVYAAARYLGSDADDGEDTTPSSHPHPPVYPS